MEDSLITKITSFISYITGGIALTVSGITINEILAVLSLVLMAATFLTNHHFHKKRDARAERQEKREQEIHDLDIKREKRKQDEFELNQRNQS